jgi:hypothetical protein
MRMQIDIKRHCYETKLQRVKWKGFQQQRSETDRRYTS